MKGTTMPILSRDPRSALAAPALAASLSHFVRARVPLAEVEDIVQSTLAEALASPRTPEEPEEIARWVHGIARHKIADWFRRRRREAPLEASAADAVPSADAPEEARDLLRWAERELPYGDEHARTFEWLLREGQGETLEAIAADAHLTAPRVRQRVSRLRRHYRERRALQAVALAALVAALVLLALVLRRRREDIAVPEAPLLPESHPALSAPLPVPMPAPSAVPERSAPVPFSTSEPARPGKVPSSLGSSGP
jgi:RNA polymerase sigma factor (sigma-70 family)